MTEIRKQRGRPKGEKSALPPAERMARTRKRRAIYKEECEKAGIVPAKPYSFDKALLSVFEAAAHESSEISVEDLIFLAMREFIVERCRDSDDWQGYVAATGIDDASKHLAMFNAARIQTVMRLSDEGLIELNLSEGL